MNWCSWLWWGKRLANLSMGMGSIGSMGMGATRSSWGIGGTTGSRGRSKASRWWAWVCLPCMVTLKGGMLRWRTSSLPKVTVCCNKQLISTRYQLEKITCEIL